MIRLAALLIVLAGPAFPACGFYQDVVSMLSGRYTEQQTFIGISSDQQRLELWVNEQTESWTIVAVSPDWTACIVAAGQAGHIIQRPPNL